jgi:hypothetical protein
MELSLISCMRLVSYAGDALFSWGLFGAGVILEGNDPGKHRRHAILVIRRHSFMFWRVAAQLAPADEVGQVGDEVNHAAHEPELEKTLLGVNRTAPLKDRFHRSRLWKRNEAMYDFRPCYVFTFFLRPRSQACPSRLATVSLSAPKKIGRPC